MKNLSVLIGFLSSLVLLSCKSGPFNLIKPATPHQAYERKLVSAGLNNTVMGTTWINNAQQSLQKALGITLPYQEKGYFSAEKIEAVAYKFQLTKGQKLQVKLDRKPVEGFMIYVDLWEQPDGVNYNLLASADTLATTIQLDVEKTGTYILRLQPELLGSGSYTVAITTGPSLDFPLKSANRNQIKSFWGVGRDNDTRKHEGIDIFAPFRTPVIAVASGTVTRVNNNNLGGKVVWFRPDGKDYNLYYAHLDEQTVTDGQTVNLGDTLGRMGSTGNAQGGPPHLHFGIYTNGGAVDPLPFVDPAVQIAPRVLSAIDLLNATMRTNAKTTLTASNQVIPLNSGTVVRVSGATGNNYRVELPDGQIGYLTSRYLTATTKPLSKLKLSIAQSLYDKPNAAAASKADLKEGETVEVIGNFEDYHLVVDDKSRVGWVKK
ncbi:MAG: hypothetical protein EOP00_11665 [Pedobacter sp.]|nr:MAG: hypothetical protein EOP00_11665 [Pedobacter sp.]